MRLRRNLGSARAWVDVVDDEPGIGPLPTPPPSIISVCGGGGRGGKMVITCLRAAHVQNALSQGVTSDQVMRDLPEKGQERGLHKLCNRIRNIIRVTRHNKRRVESSI